MTCLVIEHRYRIVLCQYLDVPNTRIAIFLKNEVFKKKMLLIVKHFFWIYAKEGVNLLQNFSGSEDLWNSASSFSTDSSNLRI